MFTNFYIFQNFINDGDLGLGNIYNIEEFTGWRPCGASPARAKALFSTSMSKWSQVRHEATCFQPLSYILLIFYHLF
jgi:hypothetical protein